MKKSFKISKRLSCFLTLLALNIFVFNDGIFAQEKQMTSVYKESLINKIALLIKENYVLRDKRGTIIAGLNQLFHNGRYQDIAEYRKMADTLTEDLLSISKDKHFAVFVPPPTAADGPKEKNQKEPDQEELDKIEKAKYESQRKYNLGFHKVEIMDGNIGYLDLRRFSGLTQAEATAHGAMAFLSHADAIIMDLRMNRGERRSWSNSSPAIFSLLILIYRS